MDKSTTKTAFFRGIAVHSVSECGVGILKSANQFKNCIEKKCNGKVC